MLDRSEWIGWDGKGKDTTEWDAGLYKKTVAGSHVLYMVTAESDNQSANIIILWL